MGFFSKLFSVKNTDGTVSKTAVAGWITAFATALAATPGGPELMTGGLAAMGKYAPLAIALVAVLSGAAINSNTGPAAK